MTRSKPNTYRPRSTSTAATTSSGKPDPANPPGKIHLLLAAPVLLGACVTDVLPPAESLPEHEPVVVALAPDASVVPQKIDPPGEPMPALKEELVVPKVQAAKGEFTRRIDRARIESHGASKAGFDATVLQAGAAFDNATWSGEARREILAYLRGGAVEARPVFTETDALVIAQLQAGSGAQADGKLRDETMAVLLATGFAFSPRKATPWQIRLEFYPAELEDLDAWREINENVAKNGVSFRNVISPTGEGSIYVRIGRSIVASYRARGGPPAPIPDDAKHLAAPTKVGVYKLGPPHAHVTPNWYFSQIPWGAEIRRYGAGFQYRWPKQIVWSWATPNPASPLKEPLDFIDFVGLPEASRDGTSVLIWNKNDFGPLAWNLVPSDLYVHTTPDAENGDAKILTASHGCIHIDPRERDEMVKSGYLGVDVPFAVRPWDEHVLPDPIRHDMVKGTGLASKS